MSSRKSRITRLSISACSGIPETIETVMKDMCVLTISLVGMITQKNLIYT